MKELPWFRFYHEMIYDEKIKVAASRTAHSYIEILGIWSILLSLAAKSPVRGKLMVASGVPYEDYDIAQICQLEVDDMKDIIKQFVELDMLLDDAEISIKNWDRRQYEKTDEEKIAHAEYVKEWREEKKKSHDNHNEITNLSPSVSVSDSVSVSGSLINNNTENIFKLYSENIAPLTQIISEKLKAAEEDYGADEICYAIRVAVEQNHRSWGYINGVLQNRKNGKGKSKKGDRTSEEARLKYAENVK